MVYHINMKCAFFVCFLTLLCGFIPMSGPKDGTLMVLVGLVELESEEGGLVQLGGLNLELELARK